MFYFSLLASPKTDLGITFELNNRLRSIFAFDEVYKCYMGLCLCTLRLSHEATPRVFSLLVQGYSTHEILAEIALFPRSI